MYINTRYISHIYISYLVNMYRYMQAQHCTSLLTVSVDPWCYHLFSTTITTNRHDAIVFTAYVATCFPFRTHPKPSVSNSWRTFSAYASALIESSTLNLGWTARHSMLQIPTYCKIKKSHFMCIYISTYIYKSFIYIYTCMFKNNIYT